MTGPGCKVAAALASALLFVACEGLPRLQVPQVEQATETVQGGGARFRAHRDCRAAARAMDDLLRCMQKAGWEFVAHTPTYPEAECWRLREEDRTSEVLPQCFVRTAVRP